MLLARGLLQQMYQDMRTHCSGAEQRMWQPLETRTEQDDYERSRERPISLCFIVLLWRIWMRGKIIAVGLLFVVVVPIVFANDHEKVPSRPTTALPLLQSKAYFQIPLDELLVPDSDWGRFAFLARLDAAGKPTSLLLLSGYTLFLSEISTALREEPFDLRYANQQVIIEVSLPRDPAPLPKGRPAVIILDNARRPTPVDKERIKLAEQRESEVEACTESMSKDDLIRQGNRDYRHKKRADEAYRCFQLALSKAPTSIAALHGASYTCDTNSEAGCRTRYLAQIVAQRPDFYEVRIALARTCGIPQDQSCTILELGKILAENPPPVVQLRALTDLVFIAQRAGRTEDEIKCREQLSEIARRYFALYPNNFDAFYCRISIVMNDGPLALRLEGIHRWAEAEEVYRRNLSMIAVDPLFEKEVKFDHELGLARTLAGKGNNNEARRICSELKWPAKFIAGLDSAYYGYASRPVEVAKWDLSCGREQEGLSLLQKESAEHPWIYAGYIALRDYYYAQGKIQSALKADEENSKAHRLADARILSSMW
jgi:tetratricopeptide (TPR) repeat protein